MGKESVNLGTYLKKMREKSNFSQMEVAKYLGHKTAQSVSDWERNSGSSIPIPSLKALIKLYRIPPLEVYEILLEHQTKLLEKKLADQFFERKKQNKAKKTAG